MRQVLRPGALGRPRGIRWRGRWEGGSEWGIHVTPWLIHVNVWQNPLKCCEVISLQLIKINEKKKRIKIVRRKKKTTSGSLYFSPQPNSSISSQFQRKVFPVVHSSAEVLWQFTILSGIANLLPDFDFQFGSVIQSCPTLGDLMDCSMLGFPVHHQLPEIAQTHIHGVTGAIQPSHPRSYPSPPAFNLSQHQGLFQWVSS